MPGHVDHIDMMKRHDRLGCLAPRTTKGHCITCAPGSYDTTTFRFAGPEPSSDLGAFECSSYHASASIGTCRCPVAELLLFLNTNNNLLVFQQQISGLCFEKCLSTIFERIRTRLRDWCKTLPQTVVSWRHPEIPCYLGISFCEPGKQLPPVLFVDSANLLTFTSRTILNHCYNRENLLISIVSGNFLTSS